MADKSPQAFRTIREVADWLEVEAHALRFWESKFSQIKPVKRAGGRRYYRPSDMRLIGGIKTLLHDQGLTIRGAQKLIREEGVAHVASLSPPLDDDLDIGADDQLVEAIAVEDSTPAAVGFVDIDALTGSTAMAQAEDPSPAPAEPDAPAAADTAPLMEDAVTAADETETPKPASEAGIAADIPGLDSEPESPVPASRAAPDAIEEPVQDIQPTPLSELRALLHVAVPFTLSQRQQLAPMVARLEALSARLEGRGPAS